MAVKETEPKAASYHVGRIRDKIASKPLLRLALDDQLKELKEREKRALGCRIEATGEIITPSFHLD